MINVLHLNDKIELVGGSEAYINDCINHGSNKGIRGFWLGIYRETSYTLKEFETGHAVRDLTIHSLVLELEKFIKKNGIEIIHIHSISNPKLIQRCSKLLPVVRTMHEPRMFCPGQGKFWRHSETICEIPFGLHCIKHAYTQGCMNRNPKSVFNGMLNTKFEIESSKNLYKAVIVMSDYMLNESLKVGIPKSVLHLNPAMTSKPDQSNDFVTKQDKRIIFIGRLSRTKGVHYLIKVCSGLMEKNYDINVDIVGDGHDAELFKGDVPDHLQHRFFFHGWQHKEVVSDLLNNSYLMIFPSIYPEAFGLSGIEAMMQGKPVVGFDVGGVGTWLKHNETGYLVPVKNVKKMAEKAQELLDDEHLYAKMSKKAREVALKEFSPELHMKKLLELYSKAKK